MGSELRVICKACLAAVRGGQADAGEIARMVMGNRWRSAPPVAARAAVLEALIADGVCFRHAMWISSCAGHRVELEQTRRDIPAGEILITYVTLDPSDPECEAVVDAKRSGGLALIERARAFVAGSRLSGLLELDPAGGRARLSLQLADADPPEILVVDSTRLAYASAEELVDVLRMRRSLPEGA